MALRLSVNSYYTNIAIINLASFHQYSVSSFIGKSRNNHCLNRKPLKMSVKSAYSGQETVAVDQEKINNLASLPSSVSSNWLEFTKNVSGEWDGHGADFTMEGKPVELPDRVVPDAYREWEVRVFDWQTQCPTLAQTEEYSLFYKLIKLLPTVGCEADAATRYTIDEKNIGGDNNMVSAFAYNSNGCYLAVCPIKDHGDYKILELEHCLVDPQNREVRVRIVQVVRVEIGSISLQNIKVFREQWYGPFRNGDQLGGCSIRDAAFAVTDALKSSEVVGIWEGLHTVASFSNSQNVFEELQDNNVRKSVRDENSMVLLPKQLWSSLKEGEGGETCCEVGWLLEQGSAITSKCTFSRNTGVKEMAIARETAAIA